jgi:hypothetical protein
MQSPYYGFGGMSKDPKQGSANQTSGIGSRWIQPEFGQPIGKFSNKPEKDKEPILRTNPQSPANTSYVGALQRTDSMVKIVESPNGLAKAPRLPNQRLSKDMVNKNLVLLKAQNEFMVAQRKGDNSDMKRLMNKGQAINKMAM